MQINIYPALQVQKGATSSTGRQGTSTAVSKKEFARLAAQSAHTQQAVAELVAHVLSKETNNNNQSSGDCDVIATTTNTTAAVDSGRPTTSTTNATNGCCVIA